MEVPQVCFESRPISSMLSEFRGDSSWLEVHLKNGSSKGGDTEQSNNCTNQSSSTLHISWGTSLQPRFYKKHISFSRMNSALSEKHCTQGKTLPTVQKNAHSAHSGKYYPQCKTLHIVQNIAHSAPLVHHFTAQPTDRERGQWEPWS